MRENGLRRRGGMIRGILGLGQRAWSIIPYYPLSRIVGRTTLARPTGLARVVPAWPDRFQMGGPARLLAWPGPGG